MKIGWGRGGGHTQGCQAGLFEAKNTKFEIFLTVRLEIFENF